MAIVPRNTRYGTRFTAVYRTTDGSQKSAGTFSTREEAKAAYHEAMGKVLRGIDPSKPAVTVYPGQVHGHETLAAYSERWLPKHRVSHNVRLSYASALKVHIIPVLGATPMADLGAFEIDQLLQGVDKLERPATTARVKAVLSAMFHAASLDKSTGVRFNFVPGIKIEPFSREPRIAFTPDEIEKLKTEVPEHYHLLIDTILGTCLRWEEAMGLKKENVRNIRGEDKVIVAHTLHELKSPHNWEVQAPDQDREAAPGDHHA